MLTKHTLIDIPVDNPFANDKLERKQIAENLTRLIESTNQPFVISIEAPWGWGKTTFINMWKSQLELKGHTCLYFNAWENDFVEDPLIAFIGEISKTLLEKRYKGKLKSSLKKLQDLGGKIIRRSIPLAIQIGTQGLLSQESVKKTSDIIFASGDEIANFTSEFAKEKIQQYESDKNSIIEFKKELASFAKTLSEEENQKTPLVFFVDELDRCKPDFSLALLERIKHVFSVEGVVFVLGIDRGQIEQSIKSVYGQGMDEDGYLRRFIDYRFHLQQPSAEGFSLFLFERFNMSEALKNRRTQHEEKEILIRVFSKLAHRHKFSLRKIEQCFTEMNLILRTIPEDILLFPEMLAFLVALKNYSTHNYLHLRSHMSYEKMNIFLESIRGDFDLTNHYDFRVLARIHANLILDYLNRNNDPRDFEQAIKDLKSLEEKENASQLDKTYSTEVLQIIGYSGMNNKHRGLRFTVSRLDLIENMIR
jgi:hypothetical protein